MYPQGVCRIRKPACAGNGCAIFRTFQTAELAEKIRRSAQTQLCGVALRKLLFPANAKPDGSKSTGRFLYILVHICIFPHGLPDSFRLIHIFRWFRIFPGHPTGRQTGIRFFPRFRHYHHSEAENTPVHLWKNPKKQKAIYFLKEWWYIYSILFAARPAADHHH